MSSVLRSVRKRKKGHTLGAVDVIDREEYAELEVAAKGELIRSLVPLGLMHIEELLDEDVTALAGERYARKAPSVGGRRHGSHPGTVGLAGQRVPIRVPRIRHVTEREIPLRSYEALHGDRAVNDLLLRRVLYGISCRNDAAAAEAIPRAIGLSGSTVSCAFIQASATKLRELQGAGPLRGGRRGPRAGRQDVRRGDDSRRAGHHDDGGQTVPGRRRDGRGKPSATAPWCTGVSGTRARTWCVTWPSVSSRCGGSVSSAPTTVRSTTRPSPPSSRSSMSWRIGTNPRPAVWRKASTRP